MMDQSFPQQASYWGRVFEVAVQRGAIAYLLNINLLTPSHPSLKQWQGINVSVLAKALIQQLKITDPEAQEWVKSGVNHVLVLGYGLGWSIVREWLQQFKVKRYRLAGIWCPLVLPNTDLDGDIERGQTVRAFQDSFSQIYPASAPFDMSLVNKGKPARADFLLWLTSHSSGKLDQVLCLELSYKISPKILEDYRQETAHQQEILRYANMLESRGVFARVCAEVQGEMLEIDPNMADFLNAFASRDKPFYKLCQGSAYTVSFLKLLRKHGCLVQDCQATAIAVTNSGLESLSAVFTAQGVNPEPRVKLMQILGQAYEQRNPLQDDDPEALTQSIQGVFKKLLKSLPKVFKDQVKPLLNSLPMVEDFRLDIQEKIEDFYEPMQLIDLETVLENVKLTPEIETFFGSNPKIAIQEVLHQKAKGLSVISLRNAHAAAIIAGLNHTPLGEMRAIALEGNPGIGKTTAVIEFLREQKQGFAFLYVSPRVVINRDVTSKFAQNSIGEKTGILTLTTNAKLINAAPKWYEQQSNSDQSRLKKDCAVVVDGCECLTKPQGSILYVTPAEEQEIDTEITRSRRHKQSLNERTDRMTSRYNSGVLTTLATGAKKLLAANPQVNRLVLTAAIQGYRELQSGTTIDALSKLFKHKAKSKLGQQERRQFAQKMPLILAMVDEIAGDGAGALFCHKIADWLQQEFIDPFEGDTPAFRVILILSDASLSNEVVLDRYLNGGEVAPDKVLISPSSVEANGKNSSRPFGAIATDLKVGRGKKKSTLHVMTNSFPASDLTIDYRLRLSGISQENDPQQPLVRLHQLIKQQKADELLNNAQQEIQRALQNGAEQIIFFAQDKRFLRDLRQLLIKDLAPHISREEIKILDQSVPEKERLTLVQSPHREQVKVFLLTSSGSRGVSFPKTDHIIALIPRFHLESSLMEVAQLIYRGRGFYQDPQTGETVDGDRRPRRLVMLIQDFFLKPTDSHSAKNSENNSEEQANLARQWLRKTSDLFTLLVMLRSTIYTRIKGDAGLRNKRLAFVPVGMIGNEEILHLMADDVTQFMYEANIFVGDPSVEDLQGVVSKASQLVGELFCRFDLTGKSSQTQAISYANYASLESLTKGLTSGRLLVNPQSDQQHLCIPENIYCVAPYWLEDWQNRQTQEQFNFDAWSDRQRENIQYLLRLLGVIMDHKGLPSKLKIPAKELYQLLERKNEASAQEYATLQEAQTRNFAVALPLDYPHFWQPHQDQDGRQQAIAEPMLWQSALGRSLSDWNLVLPVVAEYQDFPWAAVVDKQALSQLKILLNKQYFVTSHELNLLNLVLLET